MKILFASHDLQRSMVSIDKEKLVQLSMNSADQISITMEGPRENYEIVLDYIDEELRDKDYSKLVELIHGLQGAVPERDEHGNLKYSR